MNKKSKGKAPDPEPQVDAPKPAPNKVTNNDVKVNKIVGGRAYVTYDKTQNKMACRLVATRLFLTFDKGPTRTWDWSGRSDHQLLEMNLRRWAGKLHEINPDDE